MKNKSKFILVMSALAAMGLASCGGENPVESSSTEESSSSSSSEEVRKYAIIDAEHDHIRLYGLPGEAAEGETVTFGITVDVGYEFLGVVRVIAGEKEVNCTKGVDETYSFLMPAADVTISCDTDTTVYGLEYQVAEGLKVEAYEKVEAEDVDPQLAAIAGTYQGMLSYMDGDGYTERAQYTFKFDLSGMVSIEESFSETSLDARYKASSGFTIEEKEAGVYDVSFDAPIEGNDSYSIYGTVRITVTEIPATEEEPAKTIKTLTLVGGLHSAYSVIYENGSCDLVEDISAPEGGFVMKKLDFLPSCAQYQGGVYVKVPSTNRLEAGVVTFDGNVLEADENGYYYLSMPSHDATLSVGSQTRYAQISVVNSAADKVEMKAFIKEEIPEEELGDEGPTYRYVEVNKVTYDTEVFWKPVYLEEEPTVELGAFLVRYGTGSSDVIRSTQSSFKVNDDGYYEYSYYSRVKNMNYGLVCELTILDQVDGAVAMNGSAKKSLGDSSYCNLDTSKYGRVTLDTTQYWYQQDDIEGEKITLHTFTDDKEYLAYLHDGVWFIRRDSQSYLNSLYYWSVGAANGDPQEEGGAVVTPTINTIRDNSSLYSAKVGIVDVTKADGSKMTAVLGDWDEETGGEHDYVTPRFDVEFEVLNGKESVGVDGAIFDMKYEDGGVAKERTYINNSGTLASYTKGVSGTFTADGLGTIVTNGIGGLTLDGVAAIKSVAGEVGEDGKAQQSFIIKDGDTGALKLYTVTLDTHTHTFAAGVNYGTVLGDRYYGGSLSASSLTASTTATSLSSYYKLGFGKTADGASGTVDENKGYWESTGKGYTLNANGSILLNGYTIYVSANGDTAIANSGNSWYAFSTVITNYTSGCGKFVRAKVGSTKYLFSVMASSNGAVASSVAILGNTGSAISFLGWSTVSYGETEAKKYYEDGCSFSYTNEAGVVTGPVVNAKGVAERSLDGTYDGGEAGQVVVAGSTVTVAGVAHAATREDNVFTYAQTATEADGTLYLYNYTVTVDADAMTATVTHDEGTIVGFSTEYAEFALLLDPSKSTYAWSYDADTGVLKSPSGNHSQTISMTITFKSAGTFSFQAASSTEGATYDYLLIKNGDNQVCKLGGNESQTTYDSLTFTDYSVTVEAGSVITASYRKDGSVSKGVDCGYIRNLVFAA